MLGVSCCSKLNCSLRLQSQVASVHVDRDSAEDLAMAASETDENTVYQVPTISSGYSKMAVQWTDTVLPTAILVNKTKTDNAEHAIRNEFGSTKHFETLRAEVDSESTLKNQMGCK